MTDANNDPILSQTDPFTLSAWILSQQNRAPQARGHLTVLLNSICVGCKFVATSVRRAGVAGNDVLGLAGEQNVQGEDQKKLDLVANEVFKNVLKKSGQCAVLITEEEEDPIFIGDPHRGDYCVVFDPLDGSSNIECGVSIGTIFGIYKVKPGSKGDVNDVLRPGKELVAAGYCMYGSMCYLMLTTGEGVAGFTLDSHIGEFVLTHPKVTIPEMGKIYSINEGNSTNWDNATKRYVEECKASGKFSLRYVGSMVADVHRTLLYGGIFMYPADKKNPKGKLRCLYEAYPMGLLVEQAGGMAIDGQGRNILDQLPEGGVHDRSPIYLGSKGQVERIVELMKEEGIAA
jgi:fructose-1,6-bisphosphatase I